MLGDQLLPGAKTHRAGAPAAEAAIRFGATADEGLEYRVVDEIVALDAVMRRIRRAATSRSARR